MTTTREQARELAIEAASKDSELHAYTAGARNGEEWQPHAWVVDAVERALKIGHTKLGERGEELIRAIVDRHTERIDRRITTITESVTARLRALEGTGDGTSSPARTSVHALLGLVRDALVRITALEGRRGPPPGVPDLPPIDYVGGSVQDREPMPPGGYRVPDPTSESLEAANRRRERDRNELNKCTIQSDSIAQALGVPPGSREQNTQRSLAAIATLKGEVCTLRDGLDRLHDGVRHVLGKYGDAPITTAGIMDVIGNAFEDRKRLIGERNEAITQRESYAARTTAAENTAAQLSEQLRVQAESMAQWERMMRTLLESVDEEHRGEGAFMGAEQTIGRLREDIAKHIEARQFAETQRQNAANALALANSEWDATRRILNTIIAPEFDGQTLADAVINTVQTLKAQLAAQAERVGKIDEMRAELDGACEDAANHRKAVERLKAQREGYKATIAYQARMLCGKDLELQAAKRERPTYGTMRALQDTLERMTEERDGYRDGQAAMLRARDAALKGCDDLGASLTRAHRETRDATERAGRAERNATQLATRVRDLEGQLERRNKLDAMRLQDTDDLRIRIVTIADEAFGPFPVMGADHALTAIERGIWHLRRRVDIGSKLHDRCCEAIAGSGSLVAAIKEYDDAWKAERERREQAEAEFLREIGHGAPEPDDCQAGTCDCPKLPLEAKESDPSAQLDDQHGFPAPADPSNGKH